jgi:hypothetical protein
MSFAIVLAAFLSESIVCLSVGCQHGPTIDADFGGRLEMFQFLSSAHDTDRGLRFGSKRLTLASDIQLDGGTPLYPAD